MKIYGYESEDSNLISLDEVTLQVTLDDLKEIASFMNNTISLIENHGEQFGHEHFNDFVKNRKNRIPDIIITLLRE